MSMPFRSSIVLAAVLGAATATATTAPGSPATLGPQATLPIVNKVIAPDGVSRSATLAGDTFPGPIIMAGPTDTFSLNVQDQLTDKSMYKATSIHWHGLHQKNTSWSDGMAFVTQCPIVPEQSFTYQFSAQGQTGTYWYHSHYSTQYCDGLRGPLIIYDPNDPFKSMYDHDDENTVITLADWYHKPSPQHAPLDYPDSTLINGLGRTWANTTASPLAVTNVKQNMRYRLRILSLSCEPAFTFSIDHHNLTIIEADGQPHQPYTVDSVTVHAGQRYSAIITANQTVGNYWIRALPVDDGLAFTDPFAKGINSAILRYSGAAISEPTSKNTAGKNELNEARLVPYSNAAAPGGPTPDAADVHKINMNWTLNNAFQFELNGVRRTLPGVPTLLQIMSGTPVQKLLPETQYISLPKNTVIQLSFPGGASAPTTRHPMHLHGHSFAVVRSAGQTEYNFKNPPRRDVVNMGGPGDNVTIRFVTNNSGPWFLHCHVDWHLVAGFANVFVEDTPTDIASYTRPSAQWDNLCGAWNTFNATGGDTFGAPGGH